MTRFAPLTATLGLLAALALPFPASVTQASEMSPDRDADTWISQRQADLTAALNGKLAVIPDLQVRSPASPPMKTASCSAAVVSGTVQFDVLIVISSWRITSWILQPTVP